MLRRLLNRGSGRERRCLGIAVHDNRVTAVGLALESSAQLPRLLHATSFTGEPEALLHNDLVDWIEACELQGAPGHLVLAPGSYRMLQIEAPQVADNELRQAATWAVRDLIDFPLEDAVVDIFPPPESARRGKPQINVVVTRRAHVCALVDALKGRHLKLRSIDIPELAQRNVCARLPEARGGHGLVSLGQTQGLLTLYRDGELFLARQLRAGLQTLSSDMERASSALQLELQRSFDYFESTLAQPPLGALYLYPQNTEVSALAEWMAAEFSGLECHAVRLASLIEIADVEIADEGPLLHALGAALKGGA